MLAEKYRRMFLSALVAARCARQEASTTTWPAWALCERMHWWRR